MIQKWEKNVRDAEQGKLHLPNAKQQVLDPYQHMALYVYTCVLVLYCVYICLYLFLCFVTA